VTGHSSLCLDETGATVVVLTLCLSDCLCVTFSRVGDSPITGAGCYVEKGVGGAAATV